MPTLSAIYRYPVKSVAAEPLRRASVSLEGLSGDRRFMVVKPDGAFVTARRHAGLQRVAARFDGQTLSLMHDDHPAVSESWQAFAGQPFETGVWSDSFIALTTTLRLDAWFSRIVGEPVHLLWLGAQSPRYRPSIGTRVSFADGYPLLLMNEASLADLNARTDGSHVMTQFRPNIVVTGSTAFVEDGWQRLRIGKAMFRVDAPCARCVMITVNPAHGERRADGEPMRTLLRYRKGVHLSLRSGSGSVSDKDVFFGQNLVVEKTGDIGIGDDVEILA